MLSLFRIPGDITICFFIWSIKTSSDSKEYCNCSDKTIYLQVKRSFSWRKVIFYIIRLKKKLKNLYQNANTKCVSWKWLFIVHLRLHVYVITFLKSVNTSLFIWLFRYGSIILIKYASTIFCLKVFLGAVFFKRKISEVYFIKIMEVSLNSQMNSDVLTLFRNSIT